jgi:8-oxo-dGTP pyrophosphatase MutT (NUDIX family)
MRATPIGNLLPDFRHTLPPKPGSVLILLYEENGLIRFPLIKRPTYSGAHSGQVSLPGGKAESGETFVETALREGEEEIGIDRSEVEVIGHLSNFFVVPSNFMVTPVVAITQHPPILRPDTREVENILLGDLYQLLDPNAIRTKEIVAAGKFKMLAPHFEVQNEIVWGATAMMLNELRVVLQKVR